MQRIGCSQQIRSGANLTLITRSPLSKMRIFCLLLSIIVKTFGSPAEDHEGSTVDELLAQELERLLWTAASDHAQSSTHALRAASTLARLWQDDSEALCHVTSVLAGLGHVDAAAAACRRAFLVQPQEDCAIACSLHFAIWTCDFKAIDAVRPRAIARVESQVAHTSTPSTLGHLEALLILPPHLFTRHIRQQVHSLRAAYAESKLLRAPSSPLPATLGLSRRLGSRIRGMLDIAVLTSYPHQSHPHGHALLAALRGLRQMGGVRVTCFHTSTHTDPDDEVRSEIARLCHAWVALGGRSPPEVAQAINAGGHVVTIEVDGWSSPQQGRLHIAALLLRPSLVAVGAVGVVFSMGASGVFDLIISDAVASPPDLLGTQGGRERVVILGHPARGGPTSFLSPLSHTSAHTLTAPPRVGGVTLLFSDKKKKSCSEEAQVGGRRAALGLEPGAVVVGCFHSEFKISRELVSTAAKVLAAAERHDVQAVLWLGHVSAAARRNIIYELQQSGFHSAGNRTVVMQGRVAGAAHLDAKAETDLALDAPQYNGHSSTADLLWAAVPTVTHPHVTQYQRLAASILLSAPNADGDYVGARGGGGGGWVGSTVGRNSEDACEIAERLVTNVHLLARLRMNIAAVRGSWGPFQVGRWAERLVRGVRSAIELRLLDEEEDVSIEDLPPSPSSSFSADFLLFRWDVIVTR